MVKIAILISILPSLLFAHAHVFIDWKAHAVFDEEGLKGVYINWAFDRMFSAFIRNEFDTDRTGELTAEQQQRVRQGAFENLSGENYFTNILVNGQSINIPEPEQFSARLEGNVAEYTFFLPLNIKSKPENQEVTIFFYDPVIYVAYTLDNRGLSIQNKAEDSIEASIERTRVRFVTRAVINFKDKN
ncbi:ABC transporter substrate-binding protein [Chitinispirillum alkaliphilum]|nr:ABC transporter substrate-binding protein [Chitinispirillum alkaliphilum]